MEEQTAALIKKYKQQHLSACVATFELQGFLTKPLV